MNQWYVVGTGDMWINENKPALYAVLTLPVASWLKNPGISAGLRRSSYPHGIVEGMGEIIHLFHIFNLL
jgi:hypothetical protein